MTASAVANSGTKSTNPTRIIVTNDIAPADWQETFDRFDLRALSFSSVLFHAAVGTGTIGGLFALVMLLSQTLERHFPFVPGSFLLVFVLPPSLVAGAALGHAAGNLFLRLWFRFGTANRLGFASRLGLARTPGEWPAVVVRWLFTGDWLKAPEFDSRLPYARVYISGPAPQSCAEEGRLWRDISLRVSGEQAWEAGANFHEISYPRQLPTWARYIEAGDGIDDLEPRLGPRLAQEWAKNIWRRARHQWPLLGRDDFPPTARPECFELNHFFLAGGREALLVILRPAELSTLEASPDSAVAA
ncbi:MAG: hypothetical protein LBU79_06835 [Planctomycetota bacterium]|nr:hypothetical protein [Planctomycetota bacterium]